MILYSHNFVPRTGQRDAGWLYQREKGHQGLDYGNRRLPQPGWESGGLHQGIRHEGFGATKGYTVHPRRGKHNPPLDPSTL